MKINLFLINLLWVILTAKNWFIYLDIFVILGKEPILNSKRVQCDFNENVIFQLIFVYFREKCKYKTRDTKLWLNEKDIPVRPETNVIYCSIFGKINQNRPIPNASFRYSSVIANWAVLILYSKMMNNFWMYTLK